MLSGELSGIVTWRDFLKWMISELNVVNARAADLSAASQIDNDNKDLLELQISGPDFMDVLEPRSLNDDSATVHVEHGFEGCAIDGRVECVLTLPGKRPFATPGKITRCSGFGNGNLFRVHFTGLTPGQKSSLLAYAAVMAMKVG